MDVERDPLVVQFCSSKYLYNRDFDGVLEYSTNSALSIRPSDWPERASRSKQELAKDLGEPCILCKVIHSGNSVDSRMHGMHMHPSITLLVGCWLWMSPCLNGWTGTCPPECSYAKQLDPLGR